MTWAMQMWAGTMSVWVMLPRGYQRLPRRVSLCPNTMFSKYALQAGKNVLFSPTSCPCHFFKDLPWWPACIHITLAARREPSNLSSQQASLWTEHCCQSNWNHLDISLQRWNNFNLKWQYQVLCCSKDPPSSTCWQSLPRPCPAWTSWPCRCPLARCCSSSP